ncbi:GDCCVxC domain-containing (seleno)protein [Hymenobacter sp. BT730]|uniref:GDCCVxC domain-containing (seleno)protein n=1 Tax=Hymenobacter sp. BT730 TaxID=3063332 RepID=UPI0026DEA5A7|nr:GDCCVxC domain-containing (seleno)protein [Hymenobacter sp. BT730]
MTTTPSPVPQLTSLLTCPVCGHRSQEQMPTDACQYFYECSHCHTVLKPLAGDCCVFCSYGSVPCPPIQVAGPQGCCG